MRVARFAIVVAAGSISLMAHAEEPKLESILNISPKCTKETKDATESFEKKFPGFKASMVPEAPGFEKTKELLKTMSPECREPFEFLLPNKECDDQYDAYLKEIEGKEIKDYEKSINGSKKLSSFCKKRVIFISEIAKAIFTAVADSFKNAGEKKAKPAEACPTAREIISPHPKKVIKELSHSDSVKQGFGIVKTTIQYEDSLKVVAELLSWKAEGKTWKVSTFCKDKLLVEAEQLCRSGDSYDQARKCDEMRIFTIQEDGRSKRVYWLDKEGTMLAEIPDADEEKKLRQDQDPYWRSGGDVGVPAGE